MTNHLTIDCATIESFSPETVPYNRDYMCPLCAKKYVAIYCGRMYDDSVVFSNKVLPLCGKLILQWRTFETKRNLDTPSEYFQLCS